MSNNPQIRSDGDGDHLRGINADVSALLDLLKAQLDPIHSEDPELHQLWLETQWLRNNLNGSLLSRPRNWSLIVFRMARGNTALSRHPQVLQTAKLLAQALRSSFASC